MIETPRCLYLTVARSRSRPISAALRLLRLRLSPSPAREPLRRLRSAARCILLALAIPVLARAQQVDSTPRLGLGASSAISLYAGAGQIKHASLGPEVGGTIDIGWIGVKPVRLSVGIDYLAMVIDRSDSLGVRERGDGYVFSAFADVTVMPWLSRRISPTAGLGFGVDAVGTTISNEQVGALYNTNVLDLHGQIGMLYRLTPHSRVMLDVRGTSARVVRRVGVRLGYTWLFNQLGNRE